MRRGSATPLELPAPTLPGAAEGDPERERNQLEVEPERLPPDVQEVELELVSAREVPGGVDLSDPRETGPHAVAPLVTRDLVERDQRAISAHLDLGGHERP